jgi:hypothetical protein
MCISILRIRIALILLFFRNSLLFAQEKQQQSLQTNAGRTASDIDYCTRSLVISEKNIIEIFREHNIYSRTRIIKLHRSG